MSVNTRVYIGVYIKLEDYGIEIDPYDDKWHDMRCGVEGEKFSIIHDGMGGQYTYFGITLASFENIYEFDKYIINVQDVVIYESEVEERALELFTIDSNKYKHFVSRVFLFSHSS